MIERRTQPVCCGVTGLAALTEIPGHMTRIRRVLVIQLMALVAARECQMIIVRNVTRCAERCRVFPGEREIRQ